MFQYCKRFQANLQPSEGATVGRQKWRCGVPKAPSSYSGSLRVGKVRRGRAASGVTWGVESPKPVLSEARHRTKCVEYLGSTPVGKENLSRRARHLRAWCSSRTFLPGDVCYCPTIATCPQGKRVRREKTEVSGKEGINLASASQQLDMLARMRILRRTLPYVLSTVHCNSAARGREPLSPSSVVGRD